MLFYLDEVGIGTWAGHKGWDTGHYGRDTSGRLDTILLILVEYFCTFCPD
jgi:hypothetical protein